MFNDNDILPVDDIRELLDGLSPPPLSGDKQLIASASQLLGPKEDSIFARYRTDPIGYARDVLNVRWLSAMQEKMLNQLVQPQDEFWHGKLAIGTGVNFGKSFSIGIIANWYYDAWGPCIVPTTAPSQQSVIDLLWKEVRLHRGRADAKWGIGPNDFIGPQAPCMRRAPDWWARGYVAAKGEALDVETVIDSPQGKRRFGDLKVGDFVFGSDGKRVKVLAVYRQGVRTAYKVTLTDGSTIRTDANHLWQVSNWRWTAPRIMTTIQMKEYGVLHGKKNPRPIFRIPAIGALEYESKPVHIPPYTLGVWLGDGACYNATIVSADPEIPAEIEKEYGPINIRKGDKPGKVICVYGLHTKLRERGLLRGKSENKRVPIEYLQNDVATRLAVLQGLMDTDGWAQQSSCYFTSCSKGLCEDLIFLVRSLGGRATMQAKTRNKPRPEGGFYKTLYRVSVNLKAFPLFRLPRKQERVSHHGDFDRGILSIEQDGEADMMCIVVDAPDSLFVANDFIVTHNSFKGRHVDNMCFIFDETAGLSEMYFRMTKGMFKPRSTHLWVCCYNPTDTSCAMYQELMRPDSDWLSIEMSSLEHPNVLAGLRGEPLPIPAAVSMEQVEEGIKDDCEPIDAEDATATDFEWKGQWYKPGASFESDYLGRWPSSDESSLWSDALWKAASKKIEWDEIQIDEDEMPRIGCDLAYLGGAKTAMHVTWGIYSVHHESKAGQDPMKTVGRLVELADEWAEKYTQSRMKDLPPIEGKHIPIKVDDTGGGGSVVSRLRELGYNVWGVSASSQALNKKKYPNKRSELWFVTRDKAKAGLVNLGLLPQKVLVQIKKQLMAPKWSLLSTGQREVERKEMTEQRLGTSIDDADAMHLSYYDFTMKAPEVLKIQQPTFQERMEQTQGERKVNWRSRRSSKSRRGLFGR